MHFLLTLASAREVVAELEDTDTVWQLVLQARTLFGVPVRWIATPEGDHLDPTVILGTLQDGARLTAIAGAGASAMSCLAAGVYSSLAVSCSGQLYAWGEFAQLLVPALPPGEVWVGVAAGLGEHCAGLTSAGRLLVWGDNGHGQCDVPELLAGERWCTAALGSSHTVGVTTRGRLLAWGNNAEGQCDVPVLAANDVWTGAAAGFSYSAGVSCNGRLLVWGGGKSTPTPPEGEQWLGLAGGLEGVIGLSTGGSWVPSSDLHDGHLDRELLEGETCSSVVSGGYHSLRVTSSGRLVAIGSNDSGQLDVPELAPPESWLAAAAGLDHSLGLTTEGRLLAWGSNDAGEAGVPELEPGDSWAPPAACGMREQTAQAS